MKIAYIIEANAYKASGILRKAKAQVNLWKEHGHEVELFLFSPPAANAQAQPFIEGSNAFTKSSPFSMMPNVGLSSLRVWINKWMCTQELQQKLDQFAPDVLYVRQTIWTPGFEKVLERHTTVMELNSIDVYEILHTNAVWTNIYKHGRQKLLKAVKGLIPVSYEIQDFYKQEIQQYHLGSTVISNAIQESNYTGQTAPAPDGYEAVIAFVGSPGMPWHGVDKLQTLAEKLPNFLIYCAGMKLENAPSNLVSLGFIGKKELEDLYRKSHVGIASLALHRNRMEEASPLKVREYLSYGLAVVGGYKDTDISGKPFYLELENKEDNILPNIERIKEFVLSWKDRRVEPQEVAFMTVTNKEKARLDFFEQIRKQHV